jgi:hypothetical protein
VYKVQTVVGVVEIAAIVVAGAVYTKVVVVRVCRHLSQACKAHQNRYGKFANVSNEWGM